MIRFSAAIRALTQYAPLRLAVGVVTVLSGLDDLLEQMGFGADLLHLDAHHGIILFGALHALKALGDILDGVEAVEEVREKA